MEILEVFQDFFWRSTTMKTDFERYLQLQIMLTETKLIYVPKNKLTVLKDMLWINVLHSIVGSVDVRVTVLECCLEDKRGRISIPRGRTMVGAGVATLTLDISNVSVLIWY
jgi:hypothetical protein